MDGLAFLFVKGEAGTPTCEMVHVVEGWGAMWMRRVESVGRQKTGHREPRDRRVRKTGTGMREPRFHQSRGKILPMQRLGISPSWLPSGEQHERKKNSL